MHFNESKDLGQQLCEKTKKLAEDNRAAVLTYLERLKLVRSQFERYFKQNKVTESLLRSKLEVIA